MKGKRILVMGDSNGGHYMRSIVALLGLNKVAESTNGSVLGIPQWNLLREHELLYERFESTGSRALASGLGTGSAEPAVDVTVEFVRMLIAADQRLVTNAGGTMSSE